MISVGEVLEFCARAVVLLLGLSLQGIFIGFNYAHTNFPETTNLVLLLLATYVAYRIIKRVIRMWLNFVLSMIRTGFTILFIFVLFAIYVRGFHRFFTKDIYFIGNMFKLAKEESFDYKQTGFNYAYKMFDGGQNDILRRGVQALFGKGEVNVEDFNGMKGEFIAENVDGVKNFLKNNGLDANQLNDFLNNIRF